MNLQLYQVDQKSFLLDFKSLTNVEVADGLPHSDSTRSISSTPPSSSFSDLGRLSPFVLLDVDNNNIKCLYSAVSS